jgi:hypothetical protein
VQRQITASKSFKKQVEKYLIYKDSVQEKKQSFDKLNTIYFEVEKISKLTTFPCKKVQYRNSKNLQYFVFQKHHILFKLTSTHLQLMYFVASKRIKKSL